MPKGWVSKRIGELGRVVTGKTPSTKTPENFKGPYPFITIPDLDDRVYVAETSRTLSELGARSIQGAQLPAGAVMISCIATIGRCGITSKPSFTNQQINSVVPNNAVDALFLYYVFTQLGKELERAGGGGSVYTNVSKSRFSNIIVRIPSSLSEQREIAAILGALDDKIELNRRINATIEATTQAIFHDWFIGFGPTRARATGLPPYLGQHLWQQFPDTLDSNGLPNGWELRSVGDFADISGGRQLQRDLIAPHGRVPVFGGAGLMGYTEDHNADGFVITVGRVGAYCGQFFYHRGPVWINNNASLITPRGYISPEWLLHVLRNLDLDPIRKGAAQPFISNGDLSRLQIVYPGPNLIAAFHETTSNLIKRAEAARLETTTLVEIRDTLLPKLITGEIRVKNAKQLVSEAV